MKKVTKEKLQFEEKLINHVRDYPFLYDKSDKDFKNLVRRETTFETIGETLGKSGEECEALWCSLRNQFIAFTNKLKQPTGSGNNDDKPYFRHEDAMQFCKDSGEYSTNYSNVQHVDIDQENDDELSNSNITAAEREKSTVPTSKSVETSLFKDKIDAFEEKLLEVVGQTNQEDEIDLFCKSMACKIRRLQKNNALIAAQVQLKIHEVLLNAEIDCL